MALSRIPSRFARLFRVRGGAEFLLRFLPPFRGIEAFFQNSKRPGPAVENYPPSPGLMAAAHLQKWLILFYVFLRIGGLTSSEFHDAIAGPSP